MHDLRNAIMVQVETRNRDHLMRDTTQNMIRRIVDDFSSVRRERRTRKQR